MRAFLPLLLVCCGAALFMRGVTLPRYHDQAEYERRYMALSGPSRSKDFYELRQQSLTLSFKFQDYGLTLVSVSLLAFAAVHWRKTAELLPSKKTTLVAFGGLAALLTAAAEVGSLLLDYARGEFPHWADSLGIPMAGMPVILIILFSWAAVHSLLMQKRETKICRLTLRRSNWWLALLIMLTGAIMAWAAASGDFWHIIPAALWIAFYFSIWISRSIPHVESC